MDGGAAMQFVQVANYEAETKRRRQTAIISSITARYQILIYNTNLTIKYAKCIHRVTARKRKRERERERERERAPQIYIRNRKEKQKTSDILKKKRK